MGEGHGNPLQYFCLENPMEKEPGGLQSIGSHRVRHDLSDLARTQGKGGDRKGRIKAGRVIIP